MVKTAKQKGKLFENLQRKESFQQLRWPSGRDRDVPQGKLLGLAE